MLQFVDLFCGGGFGARGAVRGGGQPLLAVDAWKLATDTYICNFPDAKVIQSPIDRFGLVTWKNSEPYLRMLQPPELLRAMGAGNSHKLPFGSRREKIKLCGNGVCSPVVEVIFRKIDRIVKAGGLALAS